MKKYEHSLVVDLDCNEDTFFKIGSAYLAALKAESKEQLRGADWARIRFYLDDIEAYLHFDAICDCTWFEANSIQSFERLCGFIEAKSQIKF